MQSRERFPQAAVFAPLNTVAELRSVSSAAAAVQAGQDAAEKNEDQNQTVQPVAAAST